MDTKYEGSAGCVQFFLVAYRIDARFFFSPSATKQICLSRCYQQHPAAGAFPVCTQPAL